MVGPHGGGDVPHTVGAFDEFEDRLPVADVALHVDDLGPAPRIAWPPDGGGGGGGAAAAAEVVAEEEGGRGGIVVKSKPARQVCDLIENPLLNQVVWACCPAVPLCWASGNGRTGPDGRTLLL